MVPTGIRTVTVWGMPYETVWHTSHLLHRILCFLVVLSISIYPPMLFSSRRLFQALFCSTDMHNTIMSLMDTMFVSCFVF